MPDTLVSAAAAPRRRLILGTAVVATALALQSAVELFAGHDRTRVAVQLLVWAIEIPVVMTLLNANFARATERRHGPLPTLATNVLVAGVVGLVANLGFAAVAQRYPVVRFHPDRPVLFGRAAAYGFAFGVLHCGLWAMAFIFPFAAEDARIRALEAERLKAEVEVARLRTHLEPHFLLNTLNAIAGLVTDDPREARRLLANLGDLLRDAVSRRNETQTLEQEIYWLRRYAAILEARHAGTLRFRWNVADDTKTVLLPRLLLQPLVENAVRHGALQRRDGGEVVVSARIARPATGPERFVCMIEDNGPGVGTPREGAFGLHSVRRRLELLCPDGSLRLESTESGTRSVVELPVHRLGEATAVAVP